jgi:spore coat polysaccharide biosynthesis protein SpsF (cytidylyltransferase family)
VKFFEEIAMNINELNHEFIPLSDDGVHLSFVTAVITEGLSTEAFVTLLLNRERMLWQIIETAPENEDNSKLWHVIDENEDLKKAIHLFDNYCLNLPEYQTFEIIFNGLPRELSIPEV